MHNSSGSIAAPAYREAGRPPRPEPECDDPVRHGRGVIKARQTLIGATLALLSKVSPTLPSSREDRQAILDLLGHGTAAFGAGDITAATRYWTEAIRLCRLAGAQQLEAEALARRGEAYRVDGQFREAEKDMTAALHQAQTAGDGF